MAALYTVTGHSVMMSPTKSSTMSFPVPVMGMSNKRPTGSRVNAMGSCTDLPSGMPTPMRLVPGLAPDMGRAKSFWKLMRMTNISAMGSVPGAVDRTPMSGMSTMAELKTAVVLGSPLGDSHGAQAKENGSQAFTSN